ncbi:MAG: glycyl-radical enzyme activating protein [Desulfobacterales bacterium]
MEDQVLVTDIQKFAVNDGPGFRTNVFLKGCPMSCHWCHNPETIAPYPEIYWKSRLCHQCGACLEACPNEAIYPPIPLDQTQDENVSYHKINRSRCDRCFKCVEACPYGALSIVGKPMSIEEILTEVEKDRMFYENSGGGMTLSGGEPTSHPAFSKELLIAAKKSGIHTCLDTNGFCAQAVLENLLPYVDIVLFDIKHIDAAKHENATGVSNDIVLANLSMLLTTGKEVWVRIPVIPGFNNTMDFHEAASDYLYHLKGNIARVDLLPYHNYCQDKYAWLGIDWVLKEAEAIEPSFLEIPADVYRQKGFYTTIGGSGFENVSSFG